MKLIKKIERACEGKLPEEVKSLRLVFSKEQNKIQGLSDAEEVIWTTDCEIDTGEEGELILLFHLRGSLIIITEDTW